MTALLIISIITWLLTIWIMNGHITALEYEIQRLRSKIKNYERERLTRIR
jgi:cell division protein FtsL